VVVTDDGGYEFLSVVNDEERKKEVMGKIRKYAQLPLKLR
jgi:hypothetical protein